MALRTRHGRIIATGFLIAAAAWVPVVAQEVTNSEVAAEVEEDTSWRAKSARQLRREYRDAEESFYEAFNAVNSDDEFDIDCKTAPVLGSRKRERRCQADFLWDYEDELGEEMYRQSSTGSPGSATTSGSRIERKLEALRAEMSAAVSGYPEVAAAFAELARTKQNYDRKMSGD